MADADVNSDKAQATHVNTQESQLRETGAGMSRCRKSIRYLPSKFVDAFFNSGSLRLSSFAQFGKHEDEEKGDAREGATIMIGLAAEQTLYARSFRGHNAYILCASRVLDFDLMQRFDADAAIEIHNGPGFALAVARQLAGYREGFEGDCVYVPRRALLCSLQGTIDAGRPSSLGSSSRA